MTDEDYFICDICGERFETKNALGGHVSGHSRRIPDKQLLAELDRLEDELGRSPTIREMDELGDYSAATYKERFDSWTNALQLAGYEPIQEYRVCKEAILDEIVSLADPHGKPPTATEMRSRGEYSVKVAQNHFGSWNEALQAAGYDPHHRHRISDEELLEEIHRLVDELDKVPTAQEMSDHGQYSHRPYFRRWDGWQAAVRAAGYEPVGRPSGPDNYKWKDQSAHEWCGYGDNWKEQRLKALKRDNFTCQTPGCERTQRAHREEFSVGLNVHHIRPLSAFGEAESEVNFERANQLENLVTVCVEHHYLWERVSPLRLDTR
ncbi:homing endonuclease associated repeat-containing protein [Halopiger xanaduensis]|uniref:HNH nuclease n=1 Tax=Halopiger xanaduensis (strain DSM 18323 / JCM 14033 / SH-6) TaxID=797210 RepID=F8DEJ6_HALXS|nr:C2H2-type zinc finger protein [Halopiger xanaduensis]AEH39283.1 HNH nuclease [Halopiger xanaduensis SH-6]